MSDAEWYAERDHRSELVTTWDKTLRPVVILDSSLARSREGETVLEVLVNLLARFMRTATVAVPGGLEPHHASRLVAVARAADPRFRLELTDAIPADQSGEPRIAIGRVEAATTRFIPLTGGIAVLPATTTLPIGEAPDPMGAILAACLAARQVFAEAAGMKALLATKPYEFRAMTSGASRRHLGTVHIIGVGGVGSNIAYFAPMFGLRANFVLIDHDTVSASNLNRCLLFSDADARGKARKVAVAAEYLARHGVKADQQAMTYADYIRTHGRGTADIVLMMANEEEVWNTVQNNYPPVAYSSATSSSWGIHTARHTPIQDACVACLLGLHEQAAAPLACDAGQVGPPEKKQLGVLPFFAPLAAALTLAHVLDDLATSPLERENLRLSNFSVAYPRITRTRITKRPGCVCSAQDAAVYADVLAVSKKPEGGTIP